MGFRNSYQCNPKKNLDKYQKKLLVEFFLEIQNYDDSSVLLIKEDIKLKTIKFQPLAENKAPTSRLNFFFSIFSVRNYRSSSRA